MKHIDFAYRLGLGISSWGIAYWGGGGWSHVDMIDDDGQWWGARSDKVGGQPAGFYPRPPDYETHIKDLMILRLEVSVVQHSNFWVKAKQIKGDPYNVRGILGFALDNNWTEKKHYFCSQASAALKRHAGIIHPLHHKLFKVTPGDDALIVSSHGGIPMPPPKWFKGCHHSRLKHGMNVRI